MSYFLIIRGPLGVGKSTVAKKLARILSAELVPIDLVLEKHGLEKIKDDYVPADFIKANELVLLEVKEKLRQEKIIIFDGNFYFKEQIEHLIKNLATPYYIFTLKDPLEICLERDSKRKRSYGKAATTGVYRLASSFDYGTIIDTEQKTINQVANEILSFLPKP